MTSEPRGRSAQHTTFYVQIAAGFEYFLPRLSELYLDAADVVPAEISDDFETISEAADTFGPRIIEAFRDVGSLDDAASVVAIQDDPEFAELSERSDEAGATIDEFTLEACGFEIDEAF